MLHDDVMGKKEPTKQLAFRLPKSLYDYVVKRAGGANAKRGAQTRRIEAAIGLERALFRAFGDRKPDLQRFALDEGLDWDTQEDQVYVRLILRALEDAAQKRK